MSEQIQKEITDGLIRAVPIEKLSVMMVARSPYGRVIKMGCDS